MPDWLVDTREPNKPGANISDELHALDMTTDRQQLDVGDFISYDGEGEIIGYPGVRAESHEPSGGRKAFDMLSTHGGGML